MPHPNSQYPCSLTKAFIWVRSFAILETGDVYYCVDIAAFQTRAISGNKVTENPYGLTKFTLKLSDEYLIMKNAADIVTEMPIIQKTKKVKYRLQSNKQKRQKIPFQKIKFIRSHRLINSCSDA